MSFVKGIFSVECDRCNIKHDFDASEADFDVDGGGERQMGNENGYIWEIDFVCDCENKIDIRYEVYEYPEGSFNNEVIEVNGGSVLSSYTYDFQGEPDDEY